MEVPETAHPTGGPARTLGEGEPSHAAASDRRGGLDFQTQSPPARVDGILQVCQRPPTHLLPPALQGLVAGLALLSEKTQNHHSSGPPQTRRDGHQERTDPQNIAQGDSWQGNRSVDVSATVRQHLNPGHAGPTRGSAAPPHPRMGQGEKYRTTLGSPHQSWIPLPGLWDHEEPRGPSRRWIEGET